MTRILGMGLDLVELGRLERVLTRHGSRFVDRVCRPGEPKHTAGRGGLEHLGGLFAAKEAVMKALGTGWSAGVGFRDVEIVRAADGGPPRVRLHGRAAERAGRMGVAAVHLTITHERSMAAAVAVLEGEA